MNKNKEGVMLLTRNTEIDTRAPFRSVKEAVTLFGDKVLAGELYATATKLKHQVLYTITSLNFIRISKWLIT